MWVRAEGVYPSIVDLALFSRARAIVARRSHHYSDEELLSRLQTLLEDEGTLSGFIIDEQEEMASSSVYRHRFGSLLRAYTLIGYAPERDYRYIEVNRGLRRQHPEIVAEIIAGIDAAGGTAAVNPLTDLLDINGEFSASVVVVRCFVSPSGTSRWQLRMDTHLPVLPK